MRTLDDIGYPEFDDPDAAFSEVYEEYAENALWEMMFDELSFQPDSFLQGPM